MEKSLSDISLAIIETFYAGLIVPSNGRIPTAIEKYAERKKRNRNKGRRDNGNLDWTSSSCSSRSDSRRSGSGSLGSLERNEMLHNPVAISSAAMEQAGSFRFVSRSTQDLMLQQASPAQQEMVHRKIATVLLHKVVGHMQDAAARGLESESEQRGVDGISLAVSNYELNTLSNPDYQLGLNSWDLRTAVNHVLRAINLNPDAVQSLAWDDRIALARLSLVYSHKARIVLCIVPAIDYTDCGIALLGSWRLCPAIMQSLYKQKIELSVLHHGMTSGVQGLLDVYLAHAESLHEKVAVHQLIMDSSMWNGNHQASIEVGLEVLKEFCHFKPVITLPSYPSNITQCWLLPFNPSNYVTSSGRNPANFCHVIRTQSC
jgi:hypothetical protein